jgi:heme oxygenase
MLSQNPLTGVVRESLRAATASVHEALHQHPGFSALIEGRLTMAEYRALLARLHGFHWPLERVLRAASDETLLGFDVLGREKAQLLRDDLLWLGVQPQEIEFGPACDFVPAVRTHAELLGQLYVVEGAGLGGRILARKLDGLLGAGALDGRRFFLGRPAPDPLPWAVFCRRLEAWAERDDRLAMARSAERTFRALQQWLQGVVHHA